MFTWEESTGAAMNMEPALNELMRRHADEERIQI